MWTPAARAQLARDAHPYATSLTDAEWAIVAPFLPEPARTGRPRRWPMRLIVDAILYVLRTGGAWRHRPREFLALAHGPPLVLVPVAGGLVRAPRSRSDPSRSGACRSRGEPHGWRDRRAGRSFRRGGRRGPARLRGSAPPMGGCLIATLLVKSLLDCLCSSPRSHRRIVVVSAVGPDGRRTMRLETRPHHVERTLAWLGRCPRLARDHEATPGSALAFLVLAAMVLVRRLARAF